MVIESFDGLPLAPRAVGAMQGALREARQRGHGFIGTEHLLLGILSEPDAAATRVLARLGVVESLRDELPALMAASDYSTTPIPMSVADWELRHELLRRREHDQALRTSRRTATRDPKGELPPEALEFVDEIRRVDRDNTEWLRNVVRARGWPVRSMVGDDATNAAWLLAQHADQDPAFQRECLTLLERAVDEGEAPAAHLAYLTDRVLLAEGKPQHYGTQYKQKPHGDELEPARIEDPDRVDELRAAMGLEPLAVYLEQSRRALREQVERHQFDEHRR